MQIAKTDLLSHASANENLILKHPINDSELPFHDDLLEFQINEGEDGAVCALLTPAIKTKLREMLSGQVLEVRVDDPTAKGDIEAWCRLSGNSLLDIYIGNGTELRYFIQKK